jgi:hypothetical protein
MQHWQLPFLGLAELPAELTEFEIRSFFTFPAKEVVSLQPAGKYQRPA